MEAKAIISVLFAAVIGLVGWNIKTTHELTLSVQRLEIILLDDAMTKRLIRLQLSASQAQRSGRSNNW